MLKTCTPVLPASCIAQEGKMQEYVLPTNNMSYHHATMTYIMNEVSAASVVNLSDTYYHVLWMCAAGAAPHVDKFIARLAADTNKRMQDIASGEHKDDATYIAACNRRIEENQHWVQRCRQVSNILFAVDQKKEKEKEGM
jgi:hypothetical protein